MRRKMNQYRFRVPLKRTPVIGKITWVTASF